MADIQVFYNNTELTPTPLVNQNYQFIDYGGRWGSMIGIELQSFLTGIVNTGSWSGIANLYSGQFGTLVVKEAGTTLYSWSGVYVDEITINENGYHPGFFTPYNVRMRVYTVPSGVIDPVNEYTFSHGEDGIGTITHTVGARGVKTTGGAFQNAVNFVRNFTGKIPFGPALFPSGGIVLTNVSETIARLDCAYNVTETYKFNTGSAPTQAYIEWFSAQTSDVIDNDYITVDASVKVQGSPINRNINALDNIARNIDFKARLASIGIDTAKLGFNTDNISRNSGAATVEMRKSYISGLNASDVSGYFDYNVSLDRDNVLPKDTWKVDGEYVCRGPLDWRRQRVQAFKNGCWTDLRNYLAGLITSSPVYTAFHTYDISSAHSSLVVNENTGMAILRLSLTAYDGTWDTGINNPKYTVNVSPSKWAFDLLPSSNIEGHYVLQDPQMLTRARVSVDLSCDTFLPTTGRTVLSGYANEIANIYVDSGFVTSENITTGFLNASYNKEWLCIDKMSTGIVTTKVMGALTTDYVRQPGYKFGY